MYRECSGRCNNGNRQALNVNIGELKRGKGEEKKKKERGEKKGSIVTRLILLLVTRFSLRSFALTIFVRRFSLQSKLPRADRYMDTIRRIKENRVDGRQYERDSCENIRNLVGAKVA